MHNTTAINHNLNRFIPNTSKRATILFPFQHSSLFTLKAKPLNKDGKLLMRDLKGKRFSNLNIKTPKKALSLHQPWMNEFLPKWSFLTARSNLKLEFCITITHETIGKGQVRCTHHHPDMMSAFTRKGQIHLSILVLSMFLLLFTGFCHLFHMQIKFDSFFT